MIKLPELILNKPYELDETLVLNRIRNYDFRNHHVYGDDSFEVCRIGGYRYIGRPDGSCRMIGWQCNFADVQNYDICLPTILYVETNADNQITCLRLNENFKGSQGIPCSYKYLNRRLQDFIGLPFSQKESRISDDLGTGCRHTFEVLFGACAFREWCLQHHVKDGWLSESTASMHTEQGIIAVDRNAVNGSETATEIRISNFKETLKYDHNGAICACTDMKIEGFTRGQEGERSAIGGEKTIRRPDRKSVV